MSRSELFHIGGRWVPPISASPHDVIHPATGEVAGKISLGGVADVDRAVDAARRAFQAFSQEDVRGRGALLTRILERLDARREELALAMTDEMGTPITFSRHVQVPMALSHFEDMRRLLETHAFERPGPGGSTLRSEPIGVCGLITPWNWPLNQIASKLAPALAAGCCCVLKPSEIAPLSSVPLLEALDEAGVPPGVVNLINGDGATVGQAIAAHSDIDMVSFTGSTRAGVLVAQAAAPTVKRVTQELGGKSPNVLLPDADFALAVPAGVLRAFFNAGQSCQAPTRMIAPRVVRDQVLRLAADAAEAIRTGDPLDARTEMGPLACMAQYDRVQRLIEVAIEEGATLVCGGLGRPAGLPAYMASGSFVRPTVFADVTPSMTLARTEVFGPVLAIQFYETLAEAVALANDTTYGLAAYVQSRDPARAWTVGKALRAGRVYLNGALAAPGVPFGGYKQSGNGREQGVFGLEEYLETKAIIGDAA